MRAVARPRKARGCEHARNRQAPARFRHPSADNLFPAGGAGRIDDRADRDREQGNPRQLRRSDGTDLRRSAERSRAGQKRAADSTGLARRRSAGSAPPDSEVGETTSPLTPLASPSEEGKNPDAASIASVVRCASIASGSLRASNASPLLSS